MKNEEVRGQRKVMSMDVPVKMLFESACNVHCAECADDETMKGLVASVKEQGVLARLLVRKTEGCAFEVVDGHRRLAAAKLAGLKSVPCDVWEGMGDGEAKEAMLTANIQRLENAPLLEAEAIETMREGGMTYEQIASRLGKDAKYVARRARICNLTEKWRGWFEDKAADAAETMEMVSAHEKALQDEVYEALGMERDGEVGHEDIERAFERRKREIGKNTAFDTTACAGCAYNTSAHGLLFGTEEPGRCQKESCFVGKWNAATDEKIEKLRAKGLDVKRATNKWNVPNSWSATENKTKKNTEAWVYEDGGLKYLVFAEPDGGRGATRPTEALTEEEKAEAKRVKREHNAWKKNRRSAIEKIRDAINDDGKHKRLVAAVTGSEKFAEIMSKRFAESVSSWANDGDCLLVYEALEAEGLEAHGVELEPEEVRAIVTDDPAERVEK